MSYLQRYRLSLTTVGPVFIGSGEKRTSKEFYQGTGTVYFPDMEKLYADMLARGKGRAFEGFMLNTPTGSGQSGGQVRAATRLNEFLSSQGWLKPDVQTWGGYGVKLGELQAAKSRFDTRTRMMVAGANASLNDIATFIKDGYGQPYIPGSSLKGLLRTLIAEYFVLRDEDRTGRSRTSAPQRPRSTTAASSLESELFRTLGRHQSRPSDAVNDVMQAVRVADSQSLKLADLVVVQKIDATTNPSNDPAGLPLFRECLKPGIEVSFDVTVDTSLGGKIEEQPMERIVASLSALAARVYEKRFVAYAKKFASAVEGFSVHEKGPYVYFGGGVGYRSKTVVNDQSVMAKILDAQFNGGRRAVPHREKTAATGVSPLVLKLTRLGGEYFEMGKCKLEVRPAEA